VYLAAETAKQRATRILKGRIAIFASIAFWIISSGAIILMINLNK
jgi:hypothetical protein